MANQRSTFAKRSREMKLKDSAKAKADRREARKSEKRDTKGPAIAWDEPGGINNAAIADDADSDALPSDDAPPAAGTTSPAPNAAVPRPPNDSDR